LKAWDEVAAMLQPVTTASKAVPAHKFSTRCIRVIIIRRIPDTRRGFE
jgi:hypothetical protein